MVPLLCSFIQYKQPRCTGRTPEQQAVLNDHWVSVPTGTEEGGAFKTSRKNIYQELLFKCEDDRYELDMVIELNVSTIRALEPIMNHIATLQKEQLVNYKLRETLDGLQIRSIERIYGEKGTEIIDGLLLNPVVAVPVILHRLRQKDREWRKCRKEWNKIWKEVNEKNYHKSLDHRSQYFKQMEKKALSSKVLMAEIKQKSQDVARSRTPAAHHMNFKFRNKAALKDAFRLIFRQMDLSLTETEESSKVYQFYRYQSTSFDLVIL